MFVLLCSIIISILFASLNKSVYSVSQLSTIVLCISLSNIIPVFLSLRVAYFMKCFGMQATKNPSALEPDFRVGKKVSFAILSLFQDCCFKCGIK